MQDNASGPFPEIVRTQEQKPRIYLAADQINYEWRILVYDTKDNKLWSHGPIVSKSRSYYSKAFALKAVKHFWREELASGQAAIVEPEKIKADYAEANLVQE